MSYCFKDCAALVSVTAIPHGVTNLTGAFSGCSALSETPPLPVSVTVLKESFKDCTALTAANAIPATVTDMTGCFKGCTALLRSPVIPKSIQNMNNCFAGCSTLRSVILKCEYAAGRLTGAFTGCTGLGEKSIRVPKDQLNDYKSKAAEMGTEENRFTDGLVEVAYNDLDNYLANTALSEEINLIQITGLQAEHLKGTSSEASPLAQKLKAHPTKKLELILANIPSLTDMSYGFADCTNVFSVTPIPNGVTDMSGCFAGCTGLTEAPEIPQSVTNMYRCFAGCTALRQVQGIPQSVTDISCCFEECTGLTEAPKIPNGVTDMSSCFKGCTALRQASVIPPSVTNISCCFEECTGLTTAPEIPNGVTDMGSCFKGCTALRQAPVIPPSVTNMNSSFKDCSGLGKGPDILASDTDISYCFENCTTLTGIRLFCNCRYGGFIDAFKGCTALGNGSIKVLQDQLSVYKEYASAMGTDSTKFDNVFTVVAYGDLEAYLQNTASSSMVNYIEVTDLQAGHLEGSKEYRSPLCQKLLKVADTKKVVLKLPENIPGLSTMEYCFATCENLIAVQNLPKNVTKMNHCFRSCVNLTTAPAIPAGVTDMDCCFDSCTNLTTAPTIPAGVTGMYRCFASCTKLTGVTLKCNYIAISGQNRPFRNAFKDCTALADGSIKVSAEQLTIYTTNAGVMGTTAQKFAAITP